MNLAIFFQILNFILYFLLLFYYSNILKKLCNDFELDELDEEEEEYIFDEKSYIKKL